LEICWPGKESLKAKISEQILTASQRTLVLSGKVTPHLIVCEDNLLALPLLAARGERFHFIYIDPPYNTGQNFSFSDRQHSKALEKKNSEDEWLQFMLPRLMWARFLLKDEGVFFVSIDDRQMAALNILMMEIFGKENFVAVFKWKKKRKPSFLSKHVSSVFEYILVFAKKSSKLPKLLGEPLLETTRPVLNASNTVSLRVLKKGTLARCKDGTYSPGFYTNRTLGFETLDKMTVAESCLVDDVRVLAKFRVDQECLDRSVFVTSKFGLRRQVSAFEKTLKNVTDECVDWPTNEDAEAETIKIFGSKVFLYPKPVGMLMKLLEMYPVAKNEEINCLDFFAGSGSFAEAVVKQNSLDSASRRFVCVQSNDVLLQKNEALGTRWKTISELTEFRGSKACQDYGDNRGLEVLRFANSADVSLRDCEHLKDSKNVVLAKN
jgi:adenine-specific DNA-methyltransferase